MSKHDQKCIAFRAVNKGTLRGFATIVVRDLNMTRNRRRIGDLAGGPVNDHRLGFGIDLRPGRRSRPPRAGLLLVQRHVMQFDDAKTREAFSSAVWEAVDVFNGAAT